MRVLFVSTAATQTTGYARVAFIILTYLASQGHEIVHYAFQDYPGTRMADRTLPESVKIVDVHTIAKEGDTFGIDSFQETVLSSAPEMIIIYNDVVVTCQLLNTFLGKPKPCPIIAYLDLVYPYENSQMIRHIDDYCDGIIVFSEFWKTHLESLGVTPRKLSVFPHGVDSKRIFVVDQQEARKTLNLQPGDFLVLNNNRNSYRKAWDITVKAFLRFWKAVGCPDQVKLVINCRFDIPDGYNFQDIVRYECMRLGVDHKKVLNTNIIRLTGISGALDDSTVNLLYNACDIGINTCLGEGFGLCNLEGGSIGRAQIVTKTGGLQDIFRDFPSMLIHPVITLTICPGVETHSGELHITDPNDFSRALVTYYEDRARLKAEGDALRENVSTRYVWPSLLQNFENDIVLRQTKFKNPRPAVYWINSDARTDQRRFLESFLYERNIVAHRVTSHHRAIRRAYNEGHGDDIVLIVEDDVILPIDIYDKVRSSLEMLPMGWECLQLHYISPGMLAYACDQRPRIQRLLHGYLVGTTCYLINRKGMHKFLEMMGPEEVSVPIDETTVYGCIDTYCLMYDVTFENAFESPSKHTQKPIELPRDIHFFATKDEVEKNIS
jgi:glycosyltransferase involved in cell wall biosynthesis